MAYLLAAADFVRLSIKTAATALNLRGATLLQNVDGCARP